MSQVINLIQKLDPELNQILAPEPVAYIAPDVIAIEQQSQWTVRFNPDLYPSVRLDPAAYSTQLKRTRDTDYRRYVQKHQQDTHWLIPDFDQRHWTILRIAGKFVRRQQRFLAHRQLKSLNQHDIASSL